MGKDPAKEFNERLIAFMSAQQQPAAEDEESVPGAEPPAESPVKTD